MSAEITSWWPRWSSNCLSDQSKFQEVSSFLKLRSTPNICYLFDVGHFTAHIYKQHFLDEPSKVMFVISCSYWSKLKIDFILIPSASLSSPGEPYFFIKASSITSQKECTCPQTTAVDTVGVSSRSALSSFSCSSAQVKGDALSKITKLLLVLLVGSHLWWMLSWVGSSAPFSRWKTYLAVI